MVLYIHVFRIFKYKESGQPIICEGNIADNAPHLAKPAVTHGEYEIQQSDFLEALIKHFPANLRGKTVDEAAQKARDKIQCCDKQMLE